MSSAPLRDPVSLPYRLVRAGARLLLRAYYPDLVVEGAERVPDGPLLVCANHPNSLVDPVLVSVFLPRKIHWLAKHTLFGNPAMGAALTALGAVPVKRRHEGGDRSSTEETLRAAAESLASGRAVGIFPEGRSHDEEVLSELKSGAGRMAVLAARELAAAGNGAPLRVVTIVLHFSSKTRFRTGALVTAGTPFSVAPTDTPERVMEQIREGMASLMVHVDDAAQESLLRDARVLIRRRASLDPMRSDPKEIHRVDREVARAIRRFSAEEPERVAAFAARLRAYVEALDRQGLSLHALEDRDEPPRRTWLALGLLPVALWGVLHSGIPYALTRRLGLVQARSEDRTTVAMYLLLTGAVIFPAAWLLEAALVAKLAGWVAALAFLVTAPVTGLVARWVFHVLRRQAGRIVDALLIGSHRHAVERLQAERAWLWSEIDRWQGMLRP